MVDQAIYTNLAGSVFLDSTTLPEQEMIVERVHLPSMLADAQEPLASTHPPVRVDEGVLRMTPGSMLQGVAYPVEFDGRRHWVFTPDGDLVQILEER